MKVFITKYALTKGILEEFADVNGAGNAVISEYKKQIGMDSVIFSQGEWHTTRQAALLVAEEMRKIEIKELSTRIGELNRLCFVEQEDEDTHTSHFQ